MIDVKQAAQLASQYFAGLYEGQTASGAQLEEVEIAEDGKYWLITLSYPLTEVTGLLNFNYKRRYKVFKIDAETGEILSMKIRKVD